VLKPQQTITEGSLTIEVYGGYREIGGNCLVIKDKDRKIVFDNGIRFSIFKRYYRGKIQPLGINELRNIGIIPPLEVFEDVDALYISHFHLDHLGLLGALPPGTKVNVPSKSILGIIEEWYKTSPTWLAELPHKLNTNIIELKPYSEDELGVTPIPISHSAYPSLALVYRGHDRMVFYSGDLRVSGPLGDRISTLHNIEKTITAESINVALIEGTNIGGVETPIGSEEFKSMLNRILMEHGLIIISIDPLDLEMFITISKIASFNGRTVTIASTRLIDTIPQWLDIYENANNLKLSIASNLEKPSSIQVNYVDLSDVFKNPDDFLLVQEPMGFLEMLRQMKMWNEKLPMGAIAILTTPEPLEEEAEIEEETLASWLYSLGVQVYRIRLSGHYYPHELKSILKIVRPKKLVPIHTKHPEVMLVLANLITG